MIILFKYCADVENYENFRGFGLLYIYRLSMLITILRLQMRMRYLISEMELNECVLVLTLGF